VNVIFNNLENRIRRETPAAKLDQLIKIIQACSNAVEEDRRAQIVRSLRTLIGDNSTSNGANCDDFDTDMGASTSSDVVGAPEKSTQQTTDVIEAHSNGAGDDHADEHVQRPAVATSCSALVRGHARVNRAVDLSDGRKIFLINRREDGWFVKNHLSGLFDTKYALNKAVEAAVRELGVSYDAHVETIAKKGTWISRDVARKLVPEGVDVSDAFEEKLEDFQEPVCDESASLTLQQVMDSIRRVPDGEERAGWGSVNDVVRLVAQHGDTHVSRDREQIFSEIDFFSEISSDNPSVVTSENYRFPGAKEPTLVAPYHVLVRVVWSCKGRFAQYFQARCAKLICRAFAGDDTVVDEIRANGESLDTQNRKDLVRDIPEAGSACTSNTSCTTSTVHDSAAKDCGLPFEQQIASMRPDSLPIMAIPGLEMTAPDQEEFGKSGAYLFVDGMMCVCGVNVLVLKPGASFFGQGGMKARFDPIRRRYPGAACVMFSIPMGASDASKSETKMAQVLKPMGNAFQLGATETWLLTIAPGMDPADAARRISKQLHGCLSDIGKPVPASVPETVDRAFRAAADAANASGACGIKARIWEDECGHQFHVESFEVAERIQQRQRDNQHAVALRRVDAEVQKHTAKLDALRQTLADGLITAEQYLVAVGV
jgi:hypothetical protein